MNPMILDYAVSCIFTDTFIDKGIVTYFTADGSFGFGVDEDDCQVEMVNADGYPSNERIGEDRFYYLVAQHGPEYVWDLLNR